MDGIAREALLQLYLSEDHVVPVSWVLLNGHQSPGAQERFDFYEGDPTPLAVFGGVRSMEQWNCNLPNYIDSYNDIVDRESPLEIELDFEYDGIDQFSISADIELTDNVSPENNKLTFLVTNWIDYNDQHPWIFPVIAISDTLDFPYDTLGQTANYQQTFTIDVLPEWDVTDFRVVIFVQSMQSQEIIQAAQLQYQPTDLSEQVIPVLAKLEQNFPNPFNPNTTIPYFLEKQATDNAKIEIYNIKGQKIKTFTNLSSGTNLIYWNGKDENNNIVNSGIYFYKLKTLNSVQTKKMLMIK